MTRITQLARHAATVLVFAMTMVSLAPQASADELGGGWTKRSQKIQGTWSIVETQEGRFLELDDAFKTRRAPDLKLFLSPRAASDVTARNAVDGSVLIAKLRKARGGQRYEIPADLDLEQFETLVLHCEAFTKLWGVSSL
ncbi:MAG: DM13 domain-containing protein, partial [Pseudomonadota bacterium]